MNDARISNADISRKVGLAPSAVLERIRKLERKEVISGYETRINPRTLGLGLTTIVFIKADENVSSMEIGHQLSKLSEVQKVYCIAGEYAYLLSVCVKDTEAQTAFLEKLGNIKGIIDSNTLLVLKTLKDSIFANIENETGSPRAVLRTLRGRRQD